ncbi:MAG: LON peptidase substrate-binding domain-containing protein [Planctomycetes bacterium]|nr:LON peptidase substrate-binding domain-containing protein [Planctomycetota bacterium]
MSSDPTASELPAPGLVVPLFPLPDLILFPGVLLPLHIFEPRYRQMIQDLLDRSGKLVMGTVLGPHREALAGAPPVEPMAGIGQVENYQVLPDGRFLVLLRGVARVHVEEVPSDRLYRKVAVHPAEETPLSTPGEEEALGAELAAAIVAHSKQEIELPEGVPVAQLADVLLILLGLPAVTLYRHYANLDVGARARAALEIHRKSPA